MSVKPESQPPFPSLARDVERLLAAGPRTAVQLMTALGVSQSTVSRTMQSMARAVTSFRVKGDRTPRYALLRAFPLGLGPRQRVYRLRGGGSIEPFADVEFLAGGSTLERRGSLNRLYTGLPPYMAFAAPSGFLGRQLAAEAARSQPFPASLKDWGDDHHVAWLLTHGLNLPGNLVFGDVALQLEMDFRGQLPTPVAEKADHYLAMASQLKGAPCGASAGGEQPKFLGLAEDSGHVVVKFARRGSRMADLLPLEHLALRSLAQAGVPAASTQLLASGDCVFLEVQRFDRVGRWGRVGMLSAGAIDDEEFGRRDSWPGFAARCEQAGLLSAEDARRIDTLVAFSELIGNSDRHFENLSLLIDEDGAYAGVAPAYDILPMRYASLGGGVDPDLAPVQPRLASIGARPAVWAQAAQAAEAFWTAVQSEEPGGPISSGMRQLAATNLAVVRDFVAPLLPRGRARVAAGD